jgi:thiol-disulfide isomerase/thioredoxin
VTPMASIRDTFVMGRSYIQAMKTPLIPVAVAALALVAGPTGYAQSMTKSAQGSAGTGSMMEAGRKVIYTDLAAAQALAAKAPTVLFFAADWCPYCQADLRDINANGARLGDITIVVADYDKERQLERQYGVTAQDTFVQIDARGAKVTAWNGGGVDGILARIKRGEG